MASKMSPIGECSIPIPNDVPDVVVNINETVGWNELSQFYLNSDPNGGFGFVIEYVEINPEEEPEEDLDQYII